MALNSPTLTSASAPLIIVDDLLQKRVQQDPEKPLVAFPKTPSGLTNFELFSAKDIDFFTENAAQELLVGMTVGSRDAEVVALLGLSTLEYMITMLALSRLGYAILILSPRLSLDAYIALLTKTNSKTIVYSPMFSSTVENIRRTFKVPAFQIIPRSQFDRQIGEISALPTRCQSHATSDHVAYIMHSSGSTGLPKPIFQTHRSCLENFAYGFGLRAFSSAPLFHTHGHACLFRVLSNMGTIYFFNSNLPMTSGNLISTLDQIRPQAVYCVPYTLKLLAESQVGIDILKTAKIVSAAGSACPDEIGNKLVANGVNLITLFGATEVGQLMNSNRPEGDTAWDYMRLMPSVKPYIRMDPISSNTYHMIVLDGLKSKVISNSDDPPNSFHSRDLFTPHPVIPDAWKYIGRLDDRLTLVNGEKVLPLPMEGRIRQHPAVREAVVFGNGEEVPGLLLFRALNAQSLSDKEFISTIWPIVQEANSHAEGFSQISRNAIIIVSADVDYPHTDKGTIIRAKVYQQFADLIEDMYKKLYGNSEGHSKLTEIELHTFLLSVFKEQLEINLDNIHTDFFSVGLDSLKAVHLVTQVRATLYLGGQPEMVNPNTIYANQSISQLAAFLHALQTGTKTTDTNVIELDLMTNFIAKYSQFVTYRTPITLNTHHSQIVVLTGATGSLGTHLLAALLPLPHIRHIYCLIRGSADPMKRLLSSLRSRRLEPVSSLLEQKVISVTANFDHETLGCDASTLADIRSNQTTIIHAAWPVDFNLRLVSFEPSLLGLKHLLNLALGAHARFIFCSSVSTALNSPLTEPVPEALIPSPSFAQGSGYARSKYVAEHMCNNAARLYPGADIRILRLGQIVGDTKHGIWNASEAVPLMIRSANVLGMLPALEERCSWLPVDHCARIVLELAGLATEEESAFTTPVVDMEVKSPKNIKAEEKSQDTLVESRRARFYNILSDHPFHWTHHILPSLASHGLIFQTVPLSTWLQQLRGSSSTSDVKRNPCVKLLGFWEEKFEGETGIAGSGTNNDNGLRHQLEFSTAKARQHSRFLKHDMGGYFADGSLFGLFLQRWTEKWERKEEQQ